MPQNPHYGRPRLVALLASLAGAAVLLTHAGEALAACPALPDADLNRLDALVERDAHQTLDAVQKEIERLTSIAAPERQRMAALYAIEAHAFSMLEFDTDARTAASKGLALSPAAEDPVRINLLRTYWENIYDEASLDRAAAALAAARRSLVPGSFADLCLLISAGVVEMRRNQPAKAIAALTEAYRATARPELTEAHTLAASGLSSALRYAGDLPQALALNQEEIAYYEARGSTLQLSVSHYLRSQVLAALGNYAQAVKEATQSKRLSAKLNDSQGIAFANQSLCRNEIELGHTAAARAFCDKALEAFRTSRSTDAVLQTQAQLARIALAEGRAQTALATLKGVLANGGAELPARDQAKLFALRAQANADLSLYADAYADQSEYLRRYVAVNDAERSRQIAALRAQLETDRAIERNQGLQRELSLSQARVALQSTRLRWISIAVGAGGVAFALLSYILYSSLRHRRMLTRLATTDALTGLPNRGSTFARAHRALEEARQSGQHVTIALLDFDRFKDINDRCGHAAGDFALKEFARKSAEALRAHDTLGRWGGEEFLLILPDCSLDNGYAIVERLRGIATTIELKNIATAMPVSISAGVTTAAATGVSFDDLVAAADAALYEAKAAGRNLVRVAEASLIAASTGIRRAITLKMTARAMPAI